MKANSSSKKIQANDEEIVLIQQEAVPEVVEELAEEVATCCCKYESAIELISAAIESLAEIAKDDQIAKDSIANLGVVMLDLKGTC